MVGINTYTPLANNRLAGNAASALNPSPSTTTVEQAQYPEDYASKLQALIDLDVNYKTHPAEGMGLSSKRLIEPWLSAGAHKER